ncbi:MAG: hypothetical protein IT356_13395 [Gemmatimonadaceae bacterium]|nr:hypothetical protein [Gemmatimonadaceae bacterium]
MHFEKEIISKETLGPFSVSVLNDGIIYVELTEFMEDVDLTSIENLTELIGKLSNGIPAKIIINIKSFNTMTEEAKKYSASQRGQRFTKANAIVINSLAAKLGANFFIRFFKPVTPTKVFNSVIEAKAWLHSLN